MFATNLLANNLYFQAFGCANLFKLACAGQFSKTDQNSQRGHDASRDASRRWARRHAGRTVTQIMSCLRRKRTRTDRLHWQDASAR
jgi:hypothetical protein